MGKASAHVRVLLISYYLLNHRYQNNLCTPCMCSPQLFFLLCLIPRPRVCVLPSPPSRNSALQTKFYMSWRTPTATGTQRAVVFPHIICYATTLHSVHVLLQWKGGRYRNLKGWIQETLPKREWHVPTTLWMRAVIQTSHMDWYTLTYSTLIIHSGPLWSPPWGRTAVCIGLLCSWVQTEKWVWPETLWSNDAG